MQEQEIYKNILKRLEHLSHDSLQEVYLFINYLQMREKGKLNQIDIHHDLTLLNEQEAFHLEEEFEGYRERYPHEK